MERAESPAAWVPISILTPSWSAALERRRVALQFLVGGVLSGACFVAGHGMLGLVVFCLGFWPFRYRARWTAHGLEVAWFFLRERLALADIERARLRTDYRQLWFFRYALVLELELVGGKRAVISAPEPSLRWLAALLATPQGASVRLALDRQITGA